MQVIPRLQDIPLVMLTDFIRLQITHAKTPSEHTFDTQKDTWVTRIDDKMWVFTAKSEQPYDDLVLHKDRVYYVKTEVTPFPLQVMGVFTALGVEYKVPKDTSVLTFTKQHFTTPRDWVFQPTPIPESVLTRTPQATVKPPAH